MKVLVTGGAGFIGTNLIEYLASRGYVVYGQWEKEIRDNVMLKEVEGIDAVVHLAAKTSVVESMKNPKETWDVNVMGTLNVLEACRYNKVKKFVFASSNAASEPISPYGASKLAGEALCVAYFHSYGLSTISLRFSNVYGPHSEDKGSVIPKFIEQKEKGEELVIYGDGEQTRDFIHVDDICQAIELALGKEGITGMFQIGTGIETSINHLARLIGGRVMYDEEREGEIKRNVSDISRARRYLGFKPRISLEEGLKKLIKEGG